MPKFNDTKVATVRDLINFLEDVARAYDDEVVPYFWNNTQDSEFVLLDQFSLPVTRMVSPHGIFTAIETFNPDPDRESGKALSELLTQD